MSGSKVVIGYDRSPDFFEFLTYAGKDFFVIYTEDKSGISGVATLLIRPGMIDGKETMFQLNLVIQRQKRWNSFRWMLPDKKFGA